MVQEGAGHRRVTGLQPAQVLAGIVGVVYLVIGIIGLVRTGFGDVTGHDHTPPIVTCALPAPTFPYGQAGALVTATVTVRVPYPVLHPRHGASQFTG